MSFESLLVYLPYDNSKTEIRMKIPLQMMKLQNIRAILAYFSYFLMAYTIQNYVFESYLIYLPYYIKGNSKTEIRLKIHQ